MGRRSGEASPRVYPPAPLPYLREVRRARRWQPDPASRPNGFCPGLRGSRRTVPAAAQTVPHRSRAGSSRGLGLT